MLHVGVFILLVMSGERNFGLFSVILCHWYPLNIIHVVMLGVRLNKPYTQKLSLDLPSFTGNHADLLFLVRQWCVLC